MSKTVYSSESPSWRDICHRQRDEYMSLLTDYEALKARIEILEEENMWLRLEFKGKLNEDYVGDEDYTKPDEDQ